MAAALPASSRSGTWYAIHADHPDDAFHHVRNLLAHIGCTRTGPCRNCHAEALNVNESSRPPSVWRRQDRRYPQTGTTS